MDTTQYLEMFLDESKEHIQACNELLLALEKNPDDLAIVNEIFRSAHTLKGMSAAMGYEDIIKLTHEVENVLDAIRNLRINVTTEILDMLLKAIDLSEEMVLEIEAGGTGAKDVSEIANKLNRIELDTFQKEEVIEDAVDESTNIRGGRALNVQNSNKTIRVNIDRLDTLMNLFEELVIDRGRLQSIADELHNQDLNDTVEHITRITGDLQSVILKMRMVPVETVFNRFPKMVRQLARDLGKDVNLEITGAKTELDRMVIDEIGDSLVHLIRNAIDHGIESPGVRLTKGKLAEGSISLRAYHSGNHVFIELEDDGEGVNKERVMKKAVENGIVTEELASKLRKEQILELIMSPGFSTAETITDVSGRGVGLDVVKSKIESLGGYITITSKDGQGTKFQIQLPLTLSIITVMLVNLGEDIYAIPLTSILEVAIIRTTDIMNAHNRKVIDVKGNIVPLVDLKEVFEMDTVDEKAEHQAIIIVRKGDKMAGLLVDSFIGQQEIVLKSLGNYLQNIFAISGATILGTGKVALVVDCNALIK
ncbi:chemotaxis protein CheA [Sporosarcina highlanderae]|uniref:histidine kinase n=1 Tax=Sporosarcina highlanderae TaxID=3035916 RepID=A0ABT8JQU7_9BACL|nr:chemotaxis protein CheA [Sporosarcina highlanderae]MDN4607444.1 chemotaxis protein CheA [Sporosarcina highlanderae]